ncbi:hypothetical protein LCGC14_2452880, partial [marine sediment metagenome]
MKIYTRIKIDFNHIDTGRTVEEEFFDYEGPVSYCRADDDEIVPEVDTPTESSDERFPSGWDVDIPSYLVDFWEDFINNWFGESGTQFKDMVIADVQEQAAVSETYLDETGENTEEYQAKLDDLENTYLNEPYTFDFKVLGQTVNNIPKRSLEVIDTLSDLYTKSYDSGISQSDRSLEQNTYFTENRGELNYMETLMSFLQGTPYNQQADDDDDASVPDWINAIAGIGSLFL